MPPPKNDNPKTLTLREPHLLAAGLVVVLLPSLLAWHWVGDRVCGWLGIGRPLTMLEMLCCVWLVYIGLRAIRFGLR